jgi:hypothetical protein
MCSAGCSRCSHTQVGDGNKKKKEKELKEEKQQKK